MKDTSGDTAANVARMYGKQECVKMIDDFLSKKEKGERKRGHTSKK